MPGRDVYEDPLKNVIRDLGSLRSNFEIARQVHAFDPPDDERPGRSGTLFD